MSNNEGGARPVIHVIGGQLRDKLLIDTADVSFNAKKATYLHNRSCDGGVGRY